MREPIMKVVAAYRDALAEAEGGEVTDDLAARLDALGGEVLDRVDRYLAVSDQLAAEAGVARERAASWTAEARSRTAEAERLRRRTVEVLLAAGIERCATARYPRVAVVPGSLAVRVDPLAVSALAETHPDAVRVEITPDKARLRSLLAGGEAIEGVELVRGEPALRVR